MFNNNIFLIIFLVLIMSNASAKIIDIDDIEIVAEDLLKLDSDDLITIDVRNVLFGAKDVILMKPFKKEFKEIFAKIKEKSGELEAKRLHSIILKSYESKLIDPNMLQIIKKIQEKNIKIIAVTSGKIGQYGEIESREDLRFDVLKKLGFDFSSSFSVSNITLDNKPNEIPLIFKNGILFTSNALKGDSLSKFLQHIKFKPKKLIHIDNSMRMLVNMESYCKENNIEFLGIHFTKIFRKHSELLDSKIVEKQFEILQTEGKWISDPIAKCMIDKNLTIDQCSKL